MAKDNAQDKGLFGSLFGKKDEGKEDQQAAQSKDGSSKDRDVDITPMQQVKTPSLDKMKSLASGETGDEPFDSTALYEVSDEIKWFDKNRFMGDMNLKDTYGLEKDCNSQTEEIKNDIIRAKMSDSSGAGASANWIRQQINNVIYINVNVDKIVDIETANHTQGTWIYKSSSSDRGDLSQMKAVTNREMYDIIQRYFNNFIAYF